MAISRKLTFWEGQKRLYLDTKTPSQTCFNGIGHGKTTFGGRWIAHRVHINRRSGNKTAMSAIIAPTDKLLKRHHLPVIKHSLTEIGYIEGKHYRYHGQDRVIEFIRGSKYEIHLASGHRWENLVGWEFDCIWHDEPGFAPLALKEFTDQRVGRAAGVVCGQVLRTGVVQIGNWYYDEFGPGADLEVDGHFTISAKHELYAPEYIGKTYPRFRVGKNKICMHAPGFENPIPPSSYWERQWDTMGHLPAKYQAQVLGLPVVSTEMAVYPTFDEKYGVGDYKPDFKGHTPTLHVCFDFNYGKMSCLVAQEYETNHYVVWENSDNCATVADACEEFRKAFPPERFSDRVLMIHGDQAGYARSPQKRTRDGSYSLIKDAFKGFYRAVEIRAKRHTIEQEARVSSTVEFLSRCKVGSRALFVDKKCRKLISGFRTVSWDPKTSKIAKPSDDSHTHAPEAIDYYMYDRNPPIKYEKVGTAGGIIR